MAEFLYPNIGGNTMAAFSQGRQMRTQEDELARKKQAQMLAGQAYNAPGAEREARLGELANVDASSAVELGGQLQGAEDKKLQKLYGAARYLEQARQGKNPAQIEGAWAAVRPYLLREFPEGQFSERWDDAAMAPVLYKVLAEGGAAMGDDLKSVRIGEDGYYYAVQGGQMVNTGIKAAPQNQIIDTGAGFYGVNKGNLQAAPVTVGAPVSGGLPQARAPQQGSAGMGTGSAVNFQLDGIPGELQERMAKVSSAILAAGGTDADVDAYVRSVLPNSQSGPLAPGEDAPIIEQGGGQQLVKAPSAAEERAAQEFSAKQSRRMTPDEVQAAGYRPGTIVQVDGFGNEKVVQAPNQASQSMSAAERKNILAAKAKVPQLQNAIRGLGRIDEALAKLNMPGINTGPLDQYAVRNLPAGQELEAAVGGIQNSFLALTRVPGIGSQSDLEARIAALQYPSLDKAPEVNKRTMENLKLFARDLAKAYEAAVTQDPGNGEVAPNEIEAAADDVDDLLSKYGVQ